MQQNVNLNLILDQVAKDKGIDRPKLIEILDLRAELRLGREIHLPGAAKLIEEVDVVPPHEDL